MSDRKREQVEDKTATHNEYLHRNGVTQQIKDGMLKLIENKPENPMLFLADYFDSINSSDKTDKIQSTIKVLQLSHHSQQVFQTNLMIAYDIISAPKTSTSKKPQKVGLLGSDYEQLLNKLGINIPSSILSNLTLKVGCRSNEMVPFDVFRYGVTVCLVCSEYIELGVDLFTILCGKPNSTTADQRLCEATLFVFQNAIDSSMRNNTNPVFSLDTGYNLRPDKLAHALMETSDRSGTKLLMNQADFIEAIAQIFFAKVKQIK